MKVIVRALAMAAMLAVMLSAAPATVFAHASYVSSDPAADSVVPTAPAKVTVQFSEAMAPTGSGVQVLDSQGRRVDRDDSRVDPNDTTRMSVSLSDISEGTYTVAWRNVSAVDGHGLQGSFVFFVGSRPPGATSIEADEPPLLQSRADPFVRWSVLLGGMAALGALLFDPLVLRYVLRGERRRAVEEAAARSRRRIEQVVLAGVAAALVASLAQLILQASITADVAAYRVTAGDIGEVLSTGWGARWAVRMGCLAAAVAVLAVGWRASRGGAAPSPGGRRWALATVLLIAALVMVSMSSHGAATEGLEVLGAINDGVHLMASAVWVGGLVALLVVLQALRGVPGNERRRILAALAGRFSLFAGLSVGVLLATGLYSSWLQVASREAFDTTYGSVLISKLVLVAGLLTLGALNLFWLRPRLAGGGGEVGLRRSVGVEVLLALLVVAAAAGLTSLEPARQVRSRDAQRSALSFSETAQGTRIEGNIGPGTVGTNRVVVRISDPSGADVTNASNVTVRLKYLDRDLSPIELSAASVGGGRYETPPTVLSVGGAWQVEVEVARPGAFDVGTASRFVLASASGAASDDVSATPSASDGRTYWSWVVIAVGGLVLVLLPRAWSGRPAQARSRILGTGVLLSGVVLFYGAYTHSEPPPSVLTLTNPYPPDSRSLEIGRTLYEQQCMRCHGTAGHGDGVDAAGLVPPPADLTTHLPMHTDGIVFYFISNGFAGTAMPAFANSLSEEQRWHLVNYLRTLAQPLSDR